MYQLTNSDSILRTSDGACIPADPANTDYQQFLKDQAEGAVVEPYVLPSPKPEVLAELRTLREGIYKPLDLMQMRALSTEDTLKQEVETCKQKLRDFPATVEPLLTDDMTREEMRATVKAQYKALAADTPAHVRIAFKGLS